MRFKGKSKNTNYSLVGKSSAVQICRWTKKSLVNEDVCYKEKFYGIRCHQCCQMSPWINCQNSCLHCWREIELGLPKIEKIDNPKEIIKNCVEKQRKLLSGFGGNPKINIKKFKNAQNPEQFAISLIGEPTLYPQIGELIEELKNQKKTSFLVSNGLQPEVFEKLNKKNQLPTQLYVSLLYPDEKIFRKVTQNKSKNAWKKFNQTLELIPELNKNTRTVLRLTLIKKLNMEDKMIEQYLKLIKKANPMFIEVKGFMSVGFARKRLAYNRMPFHEDIKNFSEKLLKFLPDYKFLDEKIESRVVLLGKDKNQMKIKTD